MPESLTSESVSWENTVGDGQSEETEENIQDLFESRHISMITYHRYLQDIHPNYQTG